MATRWTGRPVALVTLVVVAVFALVGAVMSPLASAAPVDQLALRVVNQVKSGNQIQLKVFSPAMHKELPVTLLLPKGYEDGDSFPVLYALGGAGEIDDRAWVKQTDIDSFAASHGALIVLPPTEKGGFFSDWYDGSEKWETFHTVELPALIRAKFKGSNRQAVMGVSLGGFAALKYVAHHPGQYVGAASLSGVLISSAPGTTALYQTTMRLGGRNPFDIWGDPVLQHAKWNYEDPSQQLDGLRGTDLFVSAATGAPTLNGANGDGTPLERVGELSKNPTKAVDYGLSVGLEQPSFNTTKLFAQKALDAGLNVTSDYPVRGLHNWSQWKHEYKVAWSKVLAPSLGLPN